MKKIIFTDSYITVYEQPYAYGINTISVEVNGVTAFPHGISIFNSEFGPELQLSGSSQLVSTMCRYKIVFLGTILFYLEPVHKVIIHCP